MRKLTTGVAAVLAVALSTLSAGPAAAAAGPGAGAKPATATTVTAKSTATTSSTAAKIRRATGLLPPKNTLRAARLLGKPVRGLRAADLSIPASADLRSWMPPVGDQGQVGACVTWSINYGIMGYWANRAGGSGAPYAPLYTYMRIVKGPVPSSGTYPEDALSLTQAEGVDTQADYVQGTTDYTQPPTAAQIENAKSYKINGYTTLWNGARQGAAAQTLVRQALASGTPVAIGFPVYQNFFSYKTGVYNTTSGTVKGYHMTAVTGYDSTGVTLQNSWGTGWGTNGTGKVSWNFVQTAVNSAHIVAGITTPGEHAGTVPTVAGTSVKTGNGLGGTKVTIVGAGLATASKVTFGGTDAAFESTVTNGVTKLVATSPEHATGVVDVLVTNPAGTSQPSTAGKFTYTPPPPGVTGLSATSGTAVGGIELTITGARFTGAKQVRLGTVSSKFRILSDTEIAVTTARSLAGTVPITVTGPGGTSPVTDASQFTFVAPPAPAVTGLSAAAGFTYGGTPVTVSGADFTYANRVLVDGKATGFRRVSATELAIVTPVHAAATVDIRVGDQWSLSATAPAGQFTYQVPPVPAITALSLQSGPNYKATPLTITGTGFTKTSKVLVENKAVSFKFVSDTQLTATVPARPAGGAAVSVQVVAPGGTSAAVEVSTFTYVQPPKPTVQSLSVTSGLTYVRTPITITGTDYPVVSKVLVDGISVPFKRVNDTTVTATLPTHAAGAAGVQVVTPGGTSDPADGAVFTYVAPPVPVLKSLSVDNGLTYVTTPVTITGTAFTAATQVLVAGKSAPFTRLDDTTVKVSMTPRAAGPVDLQVVTPGGTSDVVTAGTFTYVAPPAPVVTGLSPATGYTIANTPVTITGTDLTAASKVLVDGVSTSFTRVNATTVKTTARAHAAGAVQIQVVTPGGTSATATEAVFTYAAPPAPTLTALSATSGAAGAARWVTATGTTLSTVTQALVGTTAVSFTRVNDTTIKILLPASTAATVEIKVVGAGGTSPTPLEYTYT